MNFEYLKLHSAKFFGMLWLRMPGFAFLPVLLCCFFQAGAQQPVPAGRRETPAAAAGLPVTKGPVASQASKAKTVQAGKPAEISAGHPGKNDTIILSAYILNGDTLGHIWLAPVDVSDHMIYHNDAERIKYLTLRRDVLKVLPYARSAGYKYRMLQYQLGQTTDRRKKRELVKALEKDIKDNYEKQLKDLTITQGRILIKLLDRETGQTSYELVKSLKSGFSAFMFQSIAGLIGDNLKEHYDPQQDKDIEFIIQSFGY